MIGSIQDIDLKLLRVFRAVVSHNGFVAAQVELGVSLPTISNQIRQLEVRVGVRLCERGNAGFSLTEAGRKLITACEHLFTAVDGFHLNVVELAKRPVGEVRLGVVDNLTTDPNGRIPQAIAAMHQKYPGVAVRFFIGPPSNLESQVLGGDLDLAIGLFPSAPPALEVQVLFQEEHGLYCARGHRLFELPDHAVLAPGGLDSPYVSWAYQETYVSADEAHPFNIQTSTPFIEGLTYLVLSGLYIGYLPTHVAKPWVDAARLRHLAPEALLRKTDVVLINRRSQRHNVVVDAFRAELERAHAAPNR
jgi:DNA-binding transcriptional LysR family regulator